MNVGLNNIFFFNKDKNLFTLNIIDLWISLFLFKYLNNILYFRQSILFYIFSPLVFFFVTLMRFNVIIRLNTLMDIIVVDRLKNFPNRFELIYCFWNLTFLKSLKLHILANVYNALFSLSNLFSSSA